MLVVWDRHYGLLDLIQAVAILQIQFPQIGVAAFVKQGGNQVFEEEIQSQLVSINLSDRFLINKSVPWVCFCDESIRCYGPSYKCF